MTPPTTPAPTPPPSGRERWPRPLELLCIGLNRVTSAWQLLPPHPYPPASRRVLLVHCHPCADSFSAACAATVAGALTRAGHEVRWRTLYDSPEQRSYLSIALPKEGGDAKRLPRHTVFPPALTEAERRHYHTIAALGPNQDAPAGLAPEVQQAVDDLQWAQDLVLVYPTWWFNVPAALKGFIDRTFLPHVAFRLPNQTNSPMVTATGLEPLLTNIERVGVVTTYGAGWATVAIAGDNGRRMISRGLRPLLAPHCSLLWDGLHGMDSTTVEGRQQFLDQIKQRYEQF